MLALILKVSRTMEKKNSFVYFISWNIKEDTLLSSADIYSL